MAVASRAKPKIDLENMIWKSGLGYRELAKKAKINQKTLYEFRTRKYRTGPQPDVIAKLAKALRVSEEELRKAILARPFVRRRPRKAKPKKAKAKAKKAKKAKAKSKPKSKK